MRGIYVSATALKNNQVCCNDSIEELAKSTNNETCPLSTLFQQLLSLCEYSPWFDTE